MTAYDLPRPRDLRAYKAVATPKYKKDYDGKLLRVHTMPETCWHWDAEKSRHVDGPDHLVPDGSVLQLRRRYTTGSGSAAFTCDWPCPCCGHKHERIIPESFLAEHRAFFVEENGLATGDGHTCVYLATPYTDEDPAIRQARWLDVSRAAAILMSQGHLVVSPISMGHPVSAMGFPGDWEAWKNVCLRLMLIADQFVIFHSPAKPVSWMASTGVSAERDLAITLGLSLWHAEFTDEAKTGLRVTADKEFGHAA